MISLATGVASRTDSRKSLVYDSRAKPPHYPHCIRAVVPLTDILVGRDDVAEGIQFRGSCKSIQVIAR